MNADGLHVMQSIGNFKIRELSTAVFESEANQTRVWVLIFASYLFIRNQTKSVINLVKKSTRTNHVSMVAMVRHGRAPDDGSANGFISASIILVTSSLKSTNFDVRVHGHDSMEPVGFSAHQYGETKPIWPFPCAPTRFDLGRSHWSTVQMSEMGAGSWGGWRFSTPQHETR